MNTNDLTAFANRQSEVLVRDLANQAAMDERWRTSMFNPENWPNGFDAPPRVPKGCVGYKPEEWSE